MHQRDVGSVKGAFVVLQDAELYDMFAFSSNFKKAKSEKEPRRMCVAHRDLN